MPQTETENCVWWQGGLLVEVQGSGKGATIYCCNSHYNTDEQSLHQEIQGYTSATHNNFHELFTTFSSTEYSIRRKQRTGTRGMLISA